QIGIRLDFKPGDGQVTCRGCVINVEMPLVCESWRKRQTQQTALLAALYPIRNFQKRPRQHLAIAYNANASGLVLHKNPSAAIGGVSDLGRTGKPLRGGNQSKRRPFDRTLAKRHCKQRYRKPDSHYHSECNRIARLRGAASAVPESTPAKLITLRLSVKLI